MRRSSGFAVAVIGTAVLLLFAVPMMMFLVIVGGTSDPQLTCAEADGPEIALAGSQTSTGLSAVQLSNASAIVSEGYRLRIPRRGLVVALAVAHQESGFLNYANDGQGGDLTPVQWGVGHSLELPHDAVGTDHGSLGVFQQQWPWWGSMEELMDPTTAATKFFDALLAVPGWQDMEVTDAGQAVQRSAFPFAYADDVPLAESLLADPKVVNSANITDASFLSGGGADCLPGSLSPGTVVYPLARGTAYVDQVNWGSSGSRWAHGHTGTDLSAACGTPVLAATAGIVVVRTDQPWAGRWLVQVSTGVGQLTTWYAHMQELDVSDGQRVAPGDQLGQVGCAGERDGMPPPLRGPSPRRLDLRGQRRSLCLARPQRGKESRRLHRAGIGRRSRRRQRHPVDVERPVHPACCSGSGADPLAALEGPGRAPAPGGDRTERQVDCLRCTRSLVGVAACRLEGRIGAGVERGSTHRDPARGRARLPRGEVRPLDDLGGPVVGRHRAGRRGTAHADELLQERRHAEPLPDDDEELPAPGPTVPGRRLPVGDGCRLEPPPRPQPANRGARCRC